MRLKKTLFRVLLTLAVVCTGSVMTNTVQSFGCQQFCANAYNTCMIDCNGDSACQTSCWYDYQCCKFLCDGSGFCQ